MIKPCTKEDHPVIYEIINDAARAYKGIIPDDRWHEPYMPMEELLAQIKDGVKFYCYYLDNAIEGVMGIQNKGEVMLIRHAYVRSKLRNSGIGSKLLEYLIQMTDKPILIGTWEDASWAIRFYQKHGFQLVDVNEKNRLLRKFWKIPERQTETSVVLADQKWIAHKPNHN